jgi:GT2 family glycosyltransferase
MPAYQGADLIGEALHSISNQDYRDFRVLISVDNGDRETATACQPWLADPRFSLVMQNQRLGWAENINWLMSQPDFELFCYWQHDDYTSPDYISALLQSLVAHPSAVCSFCGIQWTGLISEWSPSTSLAGPPITRALAIFENLNGIPLRGLIRKQVIERTGPIRRTDYDSAFEEYVWVAKLAREGELQYVDGPIYFKRARAESTHAKWHGKARLWKRAVWLEFGLGMLEVIWPLLRETEHIPALLIVLDRLCVPKPGRFVFYDGPALPLAADWLRQAQERFPIPPLQRLLTSAQADRANGAAAELLGRAIGLLNANGQDPTPAARTFRFSAGEAGVDLLLDGWSLAETWGTWSDGPHAGLQLPVGTKPGLWRAIFTFQAFGRGETVRVQLALPDASHVIEWQVPINQIVQREIAVDSRAADAVIRLSFPDATSPKILGMSTDRRRLAMGLVALALTEPGAG